MRRCEELNFQAGTATPVELMQIAGTGCSLCFSQWLSAIKFLNCRRVVIFAGHGNNGGDGIVIASELTRHLNAEIVLAMSADPENISPTSRYFFDRRSEQVTVVKADDCVLQTGDVIIDALLGTGCHGQLHEPYAALVTKINNSRLPVFSVDLPSGLGSDQAVRADCTAVIGFFKDTLFTRQGIEHSGLLRRVPLPLPLAPEAAAEAPDAADAAWFCSGTRELGRNIHKYDRGNILIAGGSREYMQAPFLTGRGALRSGAGLVRMLLPYPAVPGSGTLALIPMQSPGDNQYLTAESFAALENILPKVDVIAAGPGLGRHANTLNFIKQLLRLDHPLLLDADAIYFASQCPELLRHRSAPTVLTPHAGEARMLAAGLQITLPDDELSAARMLAASSGAVTVLKGPRTVIADPAGRTMINTSGTPALATAGTGDVLSGCIAAAMCRYQAWEAAARGAFLHGAAGILGYCQYGSDGVIADDLPEFIAEAAARLRLYGDIFI